jgi:hypothetical protein
MKIYLSLVFLMLSFNAYSSEAPGKVFYKIPHTNEIVKREMSIKVPMRGEGEVVLVSSSGHETKTKNFWTTRKFGRTVFHVFFNALTNPTDPNSPSVSMLFKGSYIRGSNKAVYWGDVFLGGKGLKAQQIKDMKFFRHAGGFAFKKEI